MTRIGIADLNINPTRIFFLNPLKFKVNSSDARMDLNFNATQIFILLKIHLEINLNSIKLKLILKRFKFYSVCSTFAPSFISESFEIVGINFIHRINDLIYQIFSSFLLSVARLCSAFEKDFRK